MSTRFSFRNIDMNNNARSAEYRQNDSTVNSTYRVPIIRPLPKKKSFWKRLFQCMFSNKEEVHSEFDL